MDLTVEAVAVHERTSAMGTHDATVATVIARPRSGSSASNVSSALSSVSSDNDDVPVAKAAKKRRNMSTPPTSVDEPGSNIARKRAQGKRGGKAALSEYDVKDRKDYLEAGLYAPANASSQPSRQARAKAPKTNRLSRSVEEIAAGFKLDLPLHHGLALLEQDRIFRLPWDILNDFDLSTLPDTIEGVAYRSEALDRIGQYETPTSYRPIKQNRLTWRQRDEAQRLAICDCKPGNSNNCDESCLNRIMQFFCAPKLCRFGSKCSNLPFSMRPIRHDLEVFWTGNRGFGLRSNTPIVAGDFIMPYTGEIITFNESYRRVVDEYQHRHDYYFLHYYDAEVVDAGMVGNEARFINHSCDPNVQVVRWKMADYDEYEIGMFALRDIDPKEELSYDYGWESYSSIDSKEAETDGVEKPKQRCFCAGESCTGYLEKAEKMREKKNQLVAKAGGKRKSAGTAKPDGKKARKSSS